MSILFQTWNQYQTGMPSLFHHPILWPLSIRDKESIGMGIQSTFLRDSPVQPFITVCLKDVKREMTVLLHAQYSVPGYISEHQI